MSIATPTAEKMNEKTTEHPATITRFEKISSISFPYLKKMMQQPVTTTKMTAIVTKLTI